MMSGADARELIINFEKGTAITLDFSGIEEIGDEFARELFITWREENPESTIAVVNARESVATVIEQIMKSR
ncbi:MAG: DUF4325 domain-containing protein [Clostridia bacterium]|nr:DUF4325 domain-containing protein [Clostridia bacterium]